jgi:hypothetical protein
MRKKNWFPPGWDEQRARAALEHYEAQTQEEAVAEDEAAYEDAAQTLMEAPKEPIPKVRELIAKHLGWQLSNSHDNPSEHLVPQLIWAASVPARPRACGLPPSFRNTRNDPYINPGAHV